MLLLDREGHAGAASYGNLDLDIPYGLCFKRIDCDTEAIYLLRPAHGAPAGHPQAWARPIHLDTRPRQPCGQGPASRLPAARAPLHRPHRAVRGAYLLAAACTPVAGAHEFRT